MSRKSFRHEAALWQERDGTWVVRIELKKGGHTTARPGHAQRVEYDDPEQMSGHFKQRVVRPLINQARARNMGAKS